MLSIFVKEITQAISLIMLMKADRADTLIFMDHRFTEYCSPSEKKPLAYCVTDRIILLTKMFTNTISVCVRKISFCKCK